MRILVCVKRVPAPGARINITPDGQEVDTVAPGVHHQPRTRSAPSRRPRSSSSSTAARRPCSRSARPTPRSSCATPCRSVCNKAVLLPTNDGEWDPQRTAQAITAAVNELEASRRRVRPDPVRQRVGRLRRLPGRGAGGLRTRPPDGQRRQGAGDRGRHRRTCSARPTPGARRTSFRCRRWSASRKASTSLATRR